MVLFLIELFLLHRAEWGGWCAEMKRQTEIEKFFSQLLFHTHVSIAQSTPGPNDEGGPLALKVKKRKMGWLGSFQDPEGLGIKDGEEGKSTYPFSPNPAPGESQTGT